MELLRSKDALTRFLGLCREHLGTPDAERLAMPLDERDDPPYLLVSRDGHGVTCLAPGMTTTVPRVPFDKVRRYLRAQSDDLRARVLIRTTDLGRDSSASRLVSFPWRLTRREFDVARTLTPLFKTEFNKAVHAATSSLMAHVQRAPESLTAPEAEHLYRGYAFAMVAVMLLADDDGMLGPAMGLSHVRDVQLAARGAWVASNRPDALLAALEEVAIKGERKRAGLAFHAVAAACVRYPKRRAEFIRLYEAVMRPEMEFEAKGLIALKQSAHARDTLPYWTWRLMPLVLQRFVPSDARAPLERALWSGNNWQQWLKGLELQHPVAAARVKCLDPLSALDTAVTAVPRRASALTRDDRIRNRIWRMLVRDHPVPLAEEDPAMRVLVTMAPVEALIPPDFPDPHLALKRGAQMVADMAPRADAPPHKPVVRTEPRVGRNDPCPCGSGRKFKKCHGA